VEGNAVIAAIVMGALLLYRRGRMLVQNKEERKATLKKGSDVHRASIEVDWGICMIQKTAFLVSE
jgi:hypothetical protein